MMRKSNVIVEGNSKDENVGNLAYQSDRGRTRIK